MTYVQSEALLLQIEKVTPLLLLKGHKLQRQRCERKSNFSADLTFEKSMVVSSRPCNINRPESRCQTAEMICYVLYNHQRNVDLEEKPQILPEGIIIIIFILSASCARPLYTCSDTVELLLVLFCRVFASFYSSMFSFQQFAKNFVTFLCQRCCPE